MNNERLCDHTLFMRSILVVLLEADASLPIGTGRPAIGLLGFRADWAVQTRRRPMGVWGASRPSYAKADILSYRSVSGGAFLVVKNVEELIVLVWKLSNLKTTSRSTSEAV